MCVCTYRRITCLDIYYVSSIADYVQSNLVHYQCYRIFWRDQKRIPQRSTDRLKTFEGESYFHEAIFTLVNPT